ncbi:hypothetical protein F511_47516 [Dorcoceras hygrometricum]|uniref:Uncharacterized protein n=1 Tax=Dorcoceras hygrometricum TaxID=472368 RepID=A0A2Z6ZRE1_9LAMI|nr:hypothetical protein F511_47516 [Dorcoceras hygrometricum]
MNDPQRYPMSGKAQRERLDEDEETRDSNRELRTNSDEELRHALKRVEIPGFDGTDPRGWLGKAEQYFELHETPLDQRLRLAHTWTAQPITGSNGCA